MVLPLVRATSGIDDETASWWSTSSRFSALSHGSLFSFAAATRGR